MNKQFSSVGFGTARDHGIGKVSKGRRRFLSLLEQLEERRLLSTVDISGGVLTYTAAASASNLTMSVDGSNLNTLDLSDSDQLITLTAGAMTEGWTGSGTNTVSGPIVSYGSGINVTGTAGDGQSLTIDFVNGDPLPASGISFTPVAGSGNALTLQNGSFTSETYLATGAGAGNITYDDSNNSSVPIAFSNLSSAIADTVSSPIFIFGAPSGSSSVNIVNGPTDNSVQTDEINDAGTGTFSLIDFGNKAGVTANVNNSGATTTVDLTTAAAGLTELFVNSGAGSDTANVEAVPSDITATVDTGSPSGSQINAGSNNVISGIQGTLIAQSTGGANSLDINDSSDANSGAATIQQGGAGAELTGLTTGSIQWGTGISNITLHGGSSAGGTAGVTYNVNYTAPGTTTDIDKGSGSGNTVNIQEISSNSTLNLTGTSTNDNVNIESGAQISGDLEINEANDSTNFTVDLSGDDLPHELLLSGDGTTTTLSDSLGNILPISLPTAVLTGLTIDTAAAQAESLTVDFSNGNPLAGLLTFNGGADSSSPADSHTLILQGGSFASETETANSPSMGSFVLTASGGGDTDIDYSGLQPTVDSVPSPNFIFNDVGTDQSFSLTDGAAGTMVITNTPQSSSTATFESDTFSNKTNVTINVPNQNGVGLDALVDAPTAATGLAVLTINVSANGGDQMNVEAAPAGVATTINGGPAADDTTVTGSGIGDGDTVTLTGGAGNDTLDYNAGGVNPTVTAGGTAGEVLITAAGSGTADAIGYENADITNIGPVTIMPGSAKTLSVTEGSTLVDAIVGTFTLPLPATIGTAPAGLPASDFTATITWGDGTASSAATIVQDATNPSVYDIIGSHTYAASGTPTIMSSIAFAGGTYTTTVNGVALNVTVPAAGSTAGTPALVNVAVGLVTVTASPVVGTEGIAIVAGPIATFTQAGTSEPASDYSATITIYNSAGATVLSDAGTIVETAANQYTVDAPSLTLATPGNYRVAVAVSNILTNTMTTAYSTATIADAALTAGTATAIAGHTGNAISSTTVGTFTSADPTASASGFSALIYWGDGSSSVGTITQPGGVGTAFVVDGSHTYATPGSFATTVDVSDQYGGSVVLSGTATVTDLPVAGSVNNFSVAVGQSTGNIVLATFTDPNPLATVSDVYAFLPANGWGDGTPTSATPLQITEIGATSTDSIFEVMGSHTYASTGTFPVNISVTTLGGVTTALTPGTATVYSLQLTATTTPAITATAKLSTGTVVVGTFTDANPAAAASDYSAIIDWGDGSPTSVGTIVFTPATSTTPATITVLGSHTYANYGTYTIHTLDTSSDGQSVTTTATANITAPHLVFATNPTGAVAGQDVPTFTVQAMDAGNNIAHEDHSRVKLAVYTGTEGNGKLLKFISENLKNGTATFSHVRINIAGTYTIVATDGRYAQAVSSTFTIVPAAATHLAVVTTPSGATPNTATSAQVELLDKYGNVASNTSTVTLKLGRHPAGGSLSGTDSVAAVAGVANFSNLIISEPGNYSLVATDAPLFKGHSGKFHVGGVED